MSVIASCGEGDGDTAPTSAPTTTTDTVTATDTGVTEPAEPDGPAGALGDQFGVRSCEVLTVTVADGGTTAEVWGTQGLNDCPQDAFSGIDPATTAAEMEVTIALPNGPRYWVLDDIVANELAGSA